MTFKDENADWLATCAIYGESTTKCTPIIVEDSFSSSSSSPSLSSATNVGFYGIVEITMSTEYTAFFRSIQNKDGHFRYFKLSEQPQLHLKFKYLTAQPTTVNTGTTTRDNDDDDDDDNDNFCKEYDWSDVTPTSVTLEWKYYPKEWTEDHKMPFLAQIWEQSNQRLQENPLSFGVCEYCEHQAISDYGPWKIFHQEDPIRMLRLPSVLDSLYHTNHGSLIHVQNEMKKLPPSTTSKCKHRKKQEIIDAKTLVNRRRPASLEEYARQVLLDEWKQLYSTECPICFDEMLFNEGVLLPCHHFVCDDCLASMLHFKVTELSGYRINPFACPVEKCRHSLPIIGFVKHYLPSDEMDKVRKWIKDMKYPPCFSLDRCLSKYCGAMESVRRVKKDSTNVYCDQCNKHWCELCLKRLKEDGSDDEGKNHKDRCQDIIAWKFCKRYLAASDDKKNACEEKYPWIISYAHAREHDGDAMTWILQNGQVCPNCSSGVERIAGCFHMQCPTCATHFCYECGDELFPPYYGTHHCWERTQLQL